MGDAGLTLSSTVKVGSRLCFLRLFHLRIVFFAVSLWTCERRFHQAARFAPIVSFESSYFLLIGFAHEFCLVAAAMWQWQQLLLLFWNIGMYLLYSRFLWVQFPFQCHQVHYIGIFLLSICVSWSCFVLANLLLYGLWKYKLNFLHALDLHLLLQPTVLFSGLVVFVAVDVYLLCARRDSYAVVLTIANGVDDGRCRR